MDVGTATSTPVSTAEVSPSPPPVAPSTSTTPAERPRSLSAIMAGEVAETAPADPGQTPPPSDPTVQATTPPVTPEQGTPAVAPTEQNQGPIPFTRHKEILENTRVKAREDALSGFKQQYGDAIQQIDAIRANPEQGIGQLITEALENPELRPGIVSVIARTMNSLRGQQQPVETPEPPADLQGTDANGQAVTFYSAPQLAKWHEWNNARLTRQFDERLQPLQKREQQMTAQERITDAQRQSRDRMKSILTQYEGRPHFKEHQKAITEKYSEIVKGGVDAATALGLAYAAILEDVVMPARASADQQALTAAAVKAASGSSSPPGVTTPSPAARPRSLSEGLRQQGVTTY